MESCPQCKELVICSESRLVQDSCGHVKCRLCLLSDSTKCFLCWQKNEDASFVIEPSINHNSEDFAIPDFIKVVPGDPVMYKCLHCKRQFKIKFNCRYHKHCNSFNSKSYSCDSCDAKFVNKSHLDYHNLSHQGSSPFICSTCEKSFKSKGKLNRHMKIHSVCKEKWICKVCNKTLFSIESFKRHMKIHEGVKKFPCVICQKSFIEYADMIKHQITHSADKNHICETCGKSFKRKYDLALHVKDHQPIRRYICRDCDKIFFRLQNLKRHMRKHKDPQYFECFDCSRMFTRKDNLERHIRSVHLDETILSPAIKSNLALENKSYHQGKTNISFQISHENNVSIPTVNNKVSVIQRVPVIVRANNNNNLSKYEEPNKKFQSNNNYELNDTDNQVKDNDIIFKQPFPVKSLTNGYYTGCLKKRY